MGRDGEGLRIVIAIEVDDLPRFKTLVEEAVAISRNEPGTLVYDWYVDEASGTARLYEAYASLDALNEHARGPVFTDLGPEFLKLCRFVQLDVFGDAGSMTGSEVLGPTRYWGSAIAAITD